MITVTINPDNPHIITTEQVVTNVTISSAGVQGPKGETGASGSTQDVSMFATTASLNTFTQSLHQFSSSIQSEVNAIKVWTASLELINTIDVEVAQLYQATASLQLFTASIQTQVNTIKVATASLQTFTSSIQAEVNAIKITTASIQSEVNAIKAWTASLELINTIDTELLQILQTTASLNSKTGSYATTGSNIFVGNQTITGSLNVSGSISASVKVDTPNINLKGGNISFDTNGAGVLHTGQFNITTVFEDNELAKTWTFNQYGTLTTPGDIVVTGSLNVSSSLTASLREGYVWVGDNTGKSTLQIATSSFGVGGGAGTSGTSGVSGTSGTSGINGVSTNLFLYEADANSFTGAPSSGHILWNNATQISATQININHLTDTPITDIDIFLSLLQVG